MRRVLIMSLAASWVLLAVKCQDGIGSSDSPTTASRLAAGDQTGAMAQSGSNQGKKKCGGIAGLVCGEDEYCAYDIGDNCGAIDRASVCEPRPLVCGFEFDPVCACDGRTYSNPCSAAAAGFGILHKGECR